jgi:hypothetical protein
MARLPAQQPSSHLLTGVNGMYEKGSVKQLGRQLPRTSEEGPQEMLKTRKSVLMGKETSLAVKVLRGRRGDERH